MVDVAQQPLQKQKPARLQLSAVQNPARPLRASFDAVVTTNDNRRHWANADALSPDAAASTAVRRMFRNRSRHEVKNNSYANGIVQTLANDTIGTGPRLQMLTDNPQLNHDAEQSFARWALEIGLAEKLRSLRKAITQDGESFIVLTTNPKLNHPVKLDLKVIEADQVTSPNIMPTRNDVDGIHFDIHGNPVSYSVLVDHPGGLLRPHPTAFVTIPASHMIHALHADRPTQHRGIPEIAPALPLFGMLRRFTLAVVAAAETAANFAAVFETDIPAGGEATDIEAMDTVELERNLATTLPPGWKLNQIDAKQPSTTYPEFKKELINEVARCLNIPFNVASGNSSSYNYASGRLDHQTYFKAIRIAQSYIAARVCDPILTAWLWEYGMTTGGVIAQPVTHQWFWDGVEHVDPAKEAKAQEMRLRNHTTTLAYEFGRQGKDYDAELRQIAKEKKLMEELGLTPAEASPLTNEDPEGDTDEVLVPQEST